MPVFLLRFLYWARRSPVSGIGVIAALVATSVVGNAFVPDEIEPGYARFLQEVAHGVVQVQR